jgi:hypothetical protein
MAKEDFCYTHYDGDEARDIAHMNRLERGAYTDIRLAQRKFGRMSVERIKKFLSKDFDEVWESIEPVLTKDEHGLYYIDWLENSINERKGYSETNSINGKLGGRPPKEFYVFKRKIEESLHEADIDAEIEFCETHKKQAAALEDEKLEKYYSWCLKFLYDLQKKETQIKAKQKLNESEPKAKRKLNESEMKASINGDVNEDEYILESIKGEKKTFNQFPDQKNLNLELPEVTIGAAIQLFKLSKGIDTTKENVLGFWSVFKTQNFTGKKFYANTGDINSHFINWIKTQNISNGTFKNKRDRQTDASAAVTSDLKAFREFNARGQSDSAA